MRSQPCRRELAVALLVLIVPPFTSGAARKNIAAAPRGASVATDSVPIAYYTFEDGMGGPDPMGWTTVDVTEELGVYFHVDDFAGLGGGDEGGLLPLSGAQSMWCGARPGGELCSYFSLPGYGNDWSQYLTSIPFTTTGDVEITFLARFDTEAGYDYTHLEYLTKSNRWERLFSFDGGGFGPPIDSLVTETIPADSLPGSAKIRFHFLSDGALSDEDGLLPTDGAVLIDSLLVSDASGIVDYQDFEDEAVGALQTDDGNWIAEAGSGFGDFAALVDGNGVLQEDSIITNTTHFWTFFNGSTQPWDCLAPDTGLVAVPNQNELGQLIVNVAASPVLDISSFLSGGLLPDSLSIWVGYDVYRDFDFPSYPFTTGIRHQILVRSDNGCWTQWLFVISEGGGTGQWTHFDYEITKLLVAGATHIQIGVGARDSYGLTCHTQAPFIDNVEVYARNVTVTGAGEASSPRYYSLHQNLPNPFNPTTTIAFDVPEPGAVVAVRVYDVAGRLVQTLRDGFAKAGPHTIDWDGRNSSGARAASGVYFCRLDAPGFSQTRKMVLLK